MNIEETVLEYLQKLPQEKQQEVLEFTQLLSHKNPLPKPDQTLLPLEDLIEASAKQEQQLTPKERMKNWLAFLETLPKQSANLPDEALHRDTMYD